MPKALIERWTISTIFKPLLEALHRVSIVSDEHEHEDESRTRFLIFCLSETGYIARIPRKFHYRWELLRRGDHVSRTR